MDVQTLFYSLGSVFLMLGIVVMVGLVVLIIIAIQTVKKAQQEVDNIKENIQARVSAFADAKASWAAKSMGMGVASFVFKKVRDMMSKGSSSK